ncbi:MAG: hypothetical protein EA366_14810 [Spirulina sp. DLM2.Bin59]|nr:MAG: hypothetical protein EA366_14810 [Spirulina sp. DLM2.Bin59]
MNCLELWGNSQFQITMTIKFYSLSLALVAAISSVGATLTFHPAAVAADPQTTPVPLDLAQANGTLMDVVDGTESLSTLGTLLRTAGLQDALGGETPMTLFAPNNAAFDALPPGVVTALLKPENRDLLTKVLSYHVLPSAMRLPEVAENRMLETASGDVLSIGRNPEGNVMVDTANVTGSENSPSNGYVHFTDGVLLPPGVASTLASREQGPIRGLW